MIINMTETVFNKLICLCQSSKRELSGVINTIVDDEEIYVLDFKLDDNLLIKSSNSHEIVFNKSEYITKIIYELMLTNNQIYIRFHTHPMFNKASTLSKADIDSLKYIQCLSKKITKNDHKNYTKIIEGIISNSEIAFYTYDLDSNSIVRLPLFCDGMEIIPSSEKNIFQIFNEAFSKGIKLTKKL